MIGQIKKISEKESDYLLLNFTGNVTTTTRAYEIKVFNFLHWNPYSLYMKKEMLYSIPDN
jgi:hypothetical protein